MSATISVHQARQLLDKLQCRLDLIGDREFYERDPDGHLQCLIAASEELERVRKECEPLPPRLAHFFDQQSFLKALDYLQQSLPTEV